MDSKLIHEEGGEKTFALVFDRGDEVVSEITNFAKETALDAATLTAIGAFSEGTLGYFDIEKRAYEKIPVEEQTEVLSMIGDIALNGGEPELHATRQARRHDQGRAPLGGPHVRPTLEVVLTESPAHLKKRTDEETGLALIYREDG